MGNKQKPQAIEDVGFDFSWDERKVWQLNVPTEDMPIDELTWHLDVPFLWSKPDGYYDIQPRWVLEKPNEYTSEWQRTRDADTAHPIDVMMWRGQWVILDGLHRLMKLYAAGTRTVRVRKIPESKIPDILK